MPDQPDLALILCPTWGPTLPPIGMATVAELAESSGRSAVCRDLNVAIYRDVVDGRLPTASAALASALFPGLPLARLWDNALSNRWDAREIDGPFELFRYAVDRLAAEMADLAPRAIGFSAYQDNLPFTVRTAQYLRERLPETPMILGGPQLDLDVRRGLFPPGVFDAFVTGEAELALAPLLADLDGLRSRNGAPPLVLHGSPPKDLDAFPFPTYRRIDLAPYEPGGVSVMTSRGCPYRCAFCTLHGLAPGFRRRSLDHVLAELAYLVEGLGMQEIHFNDNSLNADAPFLRRLADAIVERGWRIRWNASMNLTPSLDEQTVERLAASGLSQVGIGLESASDKVLRRMGKPHTRALAEQIVPRLARHGIRSRINVIVGFPGEGEAEFQETLDFLSAHASEIDTIAFVSTLHLHPGTRLWEARAELGIDPDPDKDAHRWEMPGNDAGVRLARAARVLELCCELGLPVESTNFEIDRRRIHHTCAERAGAAELALGDGAARVDEHGTHLFQHGRRLTRGDGLFFEVLLPGGNRFQTGEGVWTFQEATPDRIVAVTSWGENRFRVWQILSRTGEGEIVAEYLLQTDLEHDLAGFSFGIEPAPTYTRIVADPEAGEIRLDGVRGERAPVLVGRVEVAGGVMPIAAQTGRALVRPPLPSRLPRGLHPVGRIRWSGLTERPQAAAPVVLAQGRRIALLHERTLHLREGERWITGPRGIGLALLVPGAGWMSSRDAEWDYRESEGRIGARLRWGENLFGAKFDVTATESGFRVLVYLESTVLVHLAGLRWEIDPEPAYHDRRIDDGTLVLDRPVGESLPALHVTAGEGFSAAWPDDPETCGVLSLASTIDVAPDGPASFALDLVTRSTIVHPAVVERGRTHLARMDGRVQLLRTDVMRTAGEGLFFDLTMPDGARLHSWDARRSPASRYSSQLRWGEAPLACTEYFEILPDGSVAWRVVLSAPEGLFLARFKAGVQLGAGWEAWSVGDGTPQPIPAQAAPWTVLGPTDPVGRLPLSPDYAAGGSPELRVSGPAGTLGLTAEREPPLLAVVQAHPPGLVLGWYRSGPFMLPRGEHVLLSARLVFPP